MAPGRLTDSSAALERLAGELEVDDTDRAHVPRMQAGFSAAQQAISRQRWPTCGWWLLHGHKVCAASCGLAGLRAGRTEATMAWNREAFGANASITSGRSNMCLLRGFSAPLQTLGVGALSAALVAFHNAFGGFLPAYLCGVEPLPGQLSGSWEVRVYLASRAGRAFHCVGGVAPFLMPIGTDAEPLALQTMRGAMFCVHSPSPSSWP